MVPINVYQRADVEGSQCRDDLQLCKWHAQGAIGSNQLLPTEADYVSHGQVRTKQTMIVCRRIDIPVYLSKRGFNESICIKNNSALRIKYISYTLGHFENLFQSIAQTIYIPK